MDMVETILVTGATGTVGRKVIKQLSKGAIDVSTLRLLVIH